MTRAFSVRSSMRPTRATVSPMLFVLTVPSTAVRGSSELERYLVLQSAFGCCADVESARVPGALAFRHLTSQSASAAAARTSRAPGGPGALALRYLTSQSAFGRCCADVEGPRRAGCPRPPCWDP